MSTETRMSVSIIIPLTTTVLHSMAPKQADYPPVREVKLAITKNLRERYFVCYDFLHKCTALEPRFKALPHIEDEERQKIFSDLITEMMTTTEEEVMYYDLTPFFIFNEIIHLPQNITFLFCRMRMPQKKQPLHHLQGHHPP